jgi:hypothetical protein
VRLLIFLFTLLFAEPIAAQVIVTSSGPSKVAVTIYRDPQRSADTAIDLGNLTGFAMISETREVDLPPGEVMIRFEGVASGIQPASAIVLGTDVREKNRDRRLLSQRGLIDAFTGQAVTLRRTDKATGKVTVENGIVRSAPDALIVQTKAGFEALYCTGLDQTLLFPRVPADLTAKPTLSVTTRDQKGGRQTITLTYLASNFDWQANYVGELSADASQVNLFAWMTMASADETSFVNANAYAVAGKLERAEQGEDDTDNPYGADNLEIGYQCWPSGTTSSGGGSDYAAPPPPMDAPAPVTMQMRGRMENLESVSDIVVTAAKVAEREDLGDLKLYRIPFPVTVAAQSQKQVAFLVKPEVKGEMIYRSQIFGESSDDVQMLYRVQNKAEAGLGEALPSGQVALFQTVGGRRMLVGESQLADKAVGEEVEFVFAEANNVSVEIEDSGKSGKTWEEDILTVSNANPFPIIYEAEFRNGEDRRYERFGARLIEKRGKKIWRVTVAGNGESKLSYRQVEIVSR